MEHSKSRYDNFPENLEELVKLCESYNISETHDDVILGYLKASRGCHEISVLLKDFSKNNAKQAATLLKFITHLMMRIASDLKLYASVATSLANDILNYATNTIFNFLQAKQKPVRMKIALKLLTSMIIQSSQMAQNVFVKLGVSTERFSHLFTRSNPMEVEDVRACFIQLIVAFLTIGDNNLIRQLIDLKGFLNALFPGLVYDRPQTICIILTTLLSEVVENLSISKTSKVRLFNDFTMKYVLNLYSWRGIKRVKKSLKRKLGDDDETQIFEAKEEDILLVRNVAHKFMCALCCSYKNGIIYRDVSFGTSGRNLNHVVTNILSSFPRPYSNWCMSELVVKTLKACPDVLKFYMPKLKDSFVPRCTSAWVNAMKLLKQVVSAQDPLICFITGEKKAVPKLVTIVKSLCIPEVLPGSQIAQALEGSDCCVSYHLLDYVSCILKQVKKVIAFSSSSKQQTQYTALELLSFQQSLISNITGTLPSLRHLWNYWIRVVREGFDLSDAESLNTDVEFPAAASLISKILDVLKLLKEVSPISVKDTDINLTDILCGIKQQDGSLSHEELCSLQLTVIELIAGQAQVENLFFEKIKGEYGTSLDIVLDIFISTESPSVLKSVSDLLHQLLRKTKIFEFGEWEIDLWLHGLKEVKKRYQYHVIKFLGIVLAAVCDEPSKFIDEILSCSMDRDSKSDASCSAVCIFDEFCSNESSSGRNAVFQEGFFINMLHKQHFFSPMVPAALNCLKHLSGSKKKACRQYIEFVFRHVMHHQHSPETFFILIQKYADLFQYNLFNYWKLLYLLRKSEKIDCLEFADDGEQQQQQGRNLSEKLQSAFVAKYFHKNHIEPDGLSLPGDIPNISTEDALYITWQILMYIEMDFAAVTRNGSHSLEVMQYLALLKDLILRVVNNSNISEACQSETSSEKVMKSPVLLSVIVDILSHPTVLDWFLKTDIIQDNHNFSFLKKCMKSVIQFTLHIITCAHNNLGIIDVKKYLFPFKEKVVSFFTLHVVPTALEGKKLLIKCSLLAEILQSFAGLFSARNVTVLLEYCFQINTETWLKLDSRLTIINSLLEMYVEVQEYVLLPCEVLKSFCAMYVSVVEEELRKCIGKSFLRVLQKHPSYVHAVSSEMCSSLINQQSPDDLELLFILINNSDCHLETVQEAIISNTENWDKQNPEFITPLTAKCICTTATNSNSFQQCVSLQFWTILSSLLKCNDQVKFSDSLNCDIGRAVGTLLINKHLDVKKVKHIMKATGKLDVLLSSTTMSILLEILKEISLNSLSIELPSRSFAIKSVMNWVIQIIAASKNSEDPVQINLLNNCIITLKDMDRISIQCALSDSALWNTFLLKTIKVAIKSVVLGPSLLHIINQFCEKAHKSENSSLISASHIFELLTSHSNFFEVFLDENREYSCLKGNVLDVLILLVQMDSKVCKDHHISLFLAAYNATLSLADQKLLYLISLYEKNGIDLSSFSPFLWSNAAIAHYSVQKDTKLFLWKRPKMEEILANFIPENLLSTSLNFPLDLNLTPTYPPVEFTTMNACNEYDLYSLYDPRFVLPLISVLLSPGSFVHCRTLLESKVLGVVFTALSCRDDDIRAVGYYCLSQFYEHLQISGFNEKLVWICLLDSIRNSITGSNPRLPSMITVFLANTVDVLMKPDNPLYVPLYQFLTVKPTLDLGHVPEFYKLFGSTDIEYRIQRNWILTLLGDGLRSSVDFHLCQKRYIFSILLPYFNSPLCVLKEKVKILRILSAAVSTYSSARILCQSGLLSWLHNAIRESDKEDCTLFKHLVHIIKTLWLQEESSVEGKKIYSSFASELLLVELSLLKKLNHMDVASLLWYLETLHSTLMYLRANENDGNINLSFLSLPNIIDLQEKWMGFDNHISNNNLVQSKNEIGAVLDEEISQKCSKDDFQKCHVLFFNITLLWKPSWDKITEKASYPVFASEFICFVSRLLKTSEKYFPHVSSELSSWLWHCLKQDTEHAVVKLILSEEVNGRSCFDYILQSVEQSLKLQKNVNLHIRTADEASSLSQSLNKWTDIFKILYKGMKKGFGSEYSVSQLQNLHMLIM